VNAHAISTELLAPRLPVLGAIKIGLLGDKRTSGGGSEFQLPKKLDCFRIVTRTRGEDGNFLLDEAVHREIGDRPMELDVRLPFDTRAQNLYAQMLQYSGRTRVRQCDGRECLDPRTAVNSICERAQGKRCQCKPYARLSVILEAAPTFGGVYVYRTTSWESTSSMQTVLEMLSKELGSLRGLPMKMVLTPAEVRFSDGSGGEKTSTAYKVALVLRASFDEARTAMLDFHRTNRIARTEILQLASGTLDALDEIEAEDEPYVGAEFFPEQAQTPRSPLAQLNREIVVDPPEEEADVDALVAELRRLMEDAPTKGLKLRDSDRTSLVNAIEARNAEQLRTGIQWVQRQIGKKAPATQDEIAELERVEHMAMERDLVTEEEGASIGEAAAAGDGPMVRSWTRTLWDRLQKTPDTHDETEQGDLLGQKEA